MLRSLPPADVRAFMVGWVSAGLVIVSLAFACRPKPPAPTGCMGECPAAPAGCTRTSVDPGSCADSVCSAPLPVCRYARLPDAGDGVVCPVTLAGRCVAP